MRIRKLDIDELMGKKDVNGLINALKDGDENARRGAAEALGMIGDERVVGPLIRVVEDEDEDEQVRQAAVYAVGKIGGERAVGHLIRVLVFSPTISSALIKPTGDESMINIGWDADGWVRKGAVKSGGAAVESSMIAPVDMNMRRAAADALAEIGELAVEPLIYKLKDRDWRVYATMALVKIDGERVAESLINALKYGDRWMREGAAYALGEIGDTRVVEPLLITAIVDRAKDVCEAAVEAIGKIGGERAIEFLITALEDEDKDMRKAAAYALGEIGDKRAIESLMKALSDEDGGVRKAATRALGKIGN